MLPVLPTFFVLLLDCFYLVPIDLCEPAFYTFLLCSYTFLLLYYTFYLFYPGIWNFLCGLGALVWFLFIRPSSYTKVLANVFCIICFILLPLPPFFAPIFIFTYTVTLDVLFCDFYDLSLKFDVFVVVDIAS